MSFNCIEGGFIVATLALLCNCATTKPDSSDVFSAQIDILDSSEEDSRQEVSPEQTSQEDEVQKNAVSKDVQGEEALVPERLFDGQGSDSKEESKSEVAEKQEGSHSNESLPAIPDGGDLSGSALDNETPSPLFNSKGKGISEKSESGLEDGDKDRESSTSGSFEPSPPSISLQKISQSDSLDKNSRPDPAEKSDSIKVGGDLIAKLRRLPVDKSTGRPESGKVVPHFSSAKGTPGDGLADSHILDSKKEKKTKDESVFSENETRTLDLGIVSEDAGSLGGEESLELSEVGDSKEEKTSSQSSEKPEQGDTSPEGLPAAEFTSQVSGADIGVPKGSSAKGHFLVADRLNPTVSHFPNSDDVKRGHSDDNGLSLSFSSPRLKQEAASETSPQRYLHLSDWLTRGPRKDSAEDDLFLGRSDPSDELELKTYLDESPLVGLAPHVPWRYDAIAELLNTTQEGTSGLDASRQYRYEALRKLFGRDNPLATADDSSSPPDYENVLRWLESRSGASRNLGSQPQPKRKYSKVLHWLRGEGRRE